jgi:hypothetical protein
VEFIDVRFILRIPFLSSKEKLFPHVVGAVGMEQLGF